MIVIVSDIHLTDGSSGDTINAGAFRSFRKSLESCVQEACWRADGRFLPIAQCDVVLLGDVADVIRSSKWLAQGTIRPWSSPEELGPTVLAITNDIVTHNAEALKQFTALNGRVAVTDPSGRQLTIPLHIHYFVGNHDWFFHLPGPIFDQARRLLVNAMGLSNVPTKPFPHLLSEAEPALRDHIQKHRLYIQHGDTHDEMNYEALQGRNFSSIGDCIVVELINRFPLEVQKQLQLSKEDPDFLALREIDNVRPLLAIPSWVRGVLRRSTLHADNKRRVMNVWNQMVDNFLSLPFVRSRDTWGWDKIDKLQLGLKLSAGSSLSILSSAADRLSQFFRNESLACVALREESLLRGDADFIVYGHTHWPEAQSLDIAQWRGNSCEQLYFNTGTWRRVHQRCVREPEALEFGSFHVMSFAMFYTNGERGGRRYESWTGQLG